MNTDNAPFSPGQRVVALVSWEGNPGVMLGYSKGDVFVVDICKLSPKQKLWHVRFVSRPHDEFYDCANFAPIQESYTDETEKIAESFKEVIEQHDQKEKIKPERVLNN